MLQQQATEQVTRRAKGGCVRAAGLLPALLGRFELIFWSALPLQLPNEQPSVLCGSATDLIWRLDFTCGPAHLQYAKLVTPTVTHLWSPMYPKTQHAADHFQIQLNAAPRMASPQLLPPRFHHHLVSCLSFDKMAGPDGVTPWCCRMTLPSPEQLARPRPCASQARQSWTC